jgi:phosphate starvation-inducible protein PhoH
MKNSIILDNSVSFLGTIALDKENNTKHQDCSNIETSRKHIKKTKKQNEKEILKGFYYNEYINSIEANDQEKDRSNNRKSKKNFNQEKSYEKPYENIQYLSANEKQAFDAKFTKPKPGNQELYSYLLKQKSKKIIVATGPAGTGKTLFATEYGIRHFLLGTYEKLIFTRPSVSVDEELGFLPGTLEEKMAPWIRPIYDILYNFITPKEVTALLEDKVIEIAPLGYMRGRTFKNSWIVADEMQNSTMSQMKMLMTRLGDNSRLIITGDLEQHDRVNEINGLEDFLNKFKGKRSSSISSFEFQSNDIQREEVVKEVLEIYSGDIPESYRCATPDQELNDSEVLHSSNTDDSIETVTSMVSCIES